MPQKPELTIDALVQEARTFCESISRENHADLAGVTDGKAVGTYVEHRLAAHLAAKYRMDPGNSALGIDLPGPGVNTDIKVTSIQTPQSSCPFRTAGQKVYGLGYNLLVIVYKKEDHPGGCRLTITSCTFIEARRTGDYTLTKRLAEMLADGAGRDDIMSLLADRGLPGDEITLGQLADRILQTPPEQGYLTISNALQWRLKYQHALGLNGSVSGITNHEW